MATTPAKTVRKTVGASLQRLNADAEKALALVEVAKRQVRAAKAELKKARKLSKTAKKSAKRAKKRMEEAKASQRKAAAPKETSKVARKSPGNRAGKVKGGDGATAVTLRKATRKSFQSAADVAKSVISRMARKPAKNSTSATATEADAGHSTPAEPQSKADSAV